MRVALSIFGLCLLAACAQAPMVGPVPAGGNKPDGVVVVDSRASIYQPTPPEWGRAEAKVGKRCRRWGYRGGHSFAGDQRNCLAWDRGGRCVRSQTRRFYQCAE